MFGCCQEHLPFATLICSLWDDPTLPKFPSFSCYPPPFIVQYMGIRSNPPPNSISLALQEKALKVINILINHLVLGLLGLYIKTGRC